MPRSKAMSSQKGYGILSGSGRSKPISKPVGFGILSGNKAQTKRGRKRKEITKPNKTEFQGLGLSKMGSGGMSSMGSLKPKPKKEKKPEVKGKTIFQKWKEKREEKKRLKELEKGNGGMVPVRGQIIRSSMDTLKNGDITVSVVVKCGSDLEAMELMKSFNGCVVRA